MTDDEADQWRAAIRAHNEAERDLRLRRERPGRNLFRKLRQRRKDRREAAQHICRTWPA